VSEERPAWRQGFDAVEKAVAPRLLTLFNSEQFAIAVGLVTNAQRAVQQRAERSTRRILHLANLPAGSDVTRILAELGNLQRQMRELTKQVNASKESGPDGRTPGNDRPPRPRSTRR
jgi:hypothetical protein